MFRLVSSLPILVAMATVTPTQAAVDAGSILSKVGESYRGMSSYQFVGMVRVAISVQGQDQTYEMPFSVSVAGPSRVRTEISNPMIEIVNVSDGQQSWMYVPQFGQYTKKAAGPIKADGRGSAGQQGNPMLAGTPIARYLSVGKGLKASRLVREQSITFDGSDRDCYVVEAEYQKPATAGAEPASTTYWIDKARHLVIRDSTRVKLTGSAPANAPMHMVQVTTLSVARVNESLPDSLFSFRPPPEAKEVNQISMPGSQPAPAELVGKPAAAFTLKNLSGKPTSLAAWKGKVVLLDFWASWCGPCRMELPTIAKLHREYKNKGLAVVGVNVGETAGVAGAFLKKNNYTFPVLLDSNNQISDQYGATAIPTVVIIDRSGVVSSHFVGVRSEEDLREALKKAGMQ